MIYLMARYTDIGVTERATLSRRLSNAAGEARKKLASAGWTITADHKAAGQALLRAEIPRLHCLAHRPQAFYVCGDMYRLFSAALT